MSNIFANLIRAPRSVADYTGDMDRAEMAGLQLEGQRGQNALVALTRQQQMQQAQQAMRENNALQRIAQESGGDPQRLIGGLRGSGLPGLMTRADALEKQALDKQKTTADVGKTEAETAAKVAEARYVALDRHARNLGMVQTPEDLVAYADTTLDILGAQGPQREQAKQQMLAKAQALGLERWKQEAAQQAVPLLDKFKQDAEMKRAQLSAATTMRGQDMSAQTQMRGQDISARTAREGHSITARGQNMADARAGERLSFDKDKARKPKTDAAAGLPTESERTAGFLLQRIRDSQKQLAEAVSANPGAASPGVFQEAMRTVSEPAANLVTGPERQRVESAQLDILDSALTLGTGAAYTKEQLQGYRKSYFPQLGDSKAAIKDKAERLQNLIRAAETKAGRSATDTAPAKAGVSGGWKVEEVK